MAAGELSTSDMAKYLNITQKQLRYLEQTAILKRIAHNRWHGTNTAHAYIKHLQDTTGKSLLDQYRETLMKAKAEIAEIEAMEMKRQVAFVDDIDEAYADMILNLRAKILNIPRSLSAVQVPSDARGREIVWKKALQAALKEIAQDGIIKRPRTRRKSEEVAEVTRTTTAGNRKRVDR
jgi:DNA-binding transcriptional MerR regulator